MVGGSWSCLLITIAVGKRVGGSVVIVQLARNRQASVVRIHKMHKAEELDFQLVCEASYRVGSGGRPIICINSFFRVGRKKQLSPMAVICLGFDVRFSQIKPVEPNEPPLAIFRYRTLNDLGALIRRLADIQLERLDQQNRFGRRALVFLAHSALTDKRSTRSCKVPGFLFPWVLSISIRISHHPSVRCVSGS